MTFTLSGLPRWSEKIFIDTDYLYLIFIPIEQFTASVRRPHSPVGALPLNPTCAYIPGTITIDLINIEIS
jgi:hypothetical protein